MSGIRRLRFVDGYPSCRPRTPALPGGVSLLPVSLLVLGLLPFYWVSVLSDTRSLVCSLNRFGPRHPCGVRSMMPLTDRSCSLLGVVRPAEWKQGTATPGRKTTTGFTLCGPSLWGYVRCCLYRCQAGLLGSKVPQLPLLASFFRVGSFIRSDCAAPSPLWCCLRPGEVILQCRDQQG
jgi:hypothetical protein